MTKCADWSPPIEGAARSLINVILHALTGGDRRGAGAEVRGEVEALLRTSGETPMTPPEASSTR